MQFSSIVDCCVQLCPKTAACLCSGLHFLFAIGEMVPLKGGMPYLMSSVLKDWKIDHEDEKLQPSLQLLKTVVLNAGAYNLIVGLGFLWAVFPFGMDFKPAPELARPLLAFFSVAAILAGFVGLKLSKKTVVQIALGAFGLISLWF